MELPFTKWEGLGNDFVVLDEGREVSPATARKLCDRHFGIGADGVLMVAVRNGRPRFRVINADGSAPEMCGNGIRCVALHLVRTGAMTERAFFVDTDAGPHRCVVGDDGEVAVDMAVPSLAPAEIPVKATAPLVDAPFEVLGHTLRLTAVSMGNPHAVTFDELGDARLELGPAVESDPRFPARVNVGFARLAHRGWIDLDVYERGAGWTRACGTGACAAAVAAVETGRAARGSQIAVHLPGGRLVVTVGEPGAPVTMRGPARLVFEGRVVVNGERR